MYGQWPIYGQWTSVAIGCARTLPRTSSWGQQFGADRRARPVCLAAVPAHDVAIVPGRDPRYRDMLAGTPVGKLRRSIRQVGR